MKKRFFVLLLTLCLVFALAPAAMAAATEGHAGADITWAYDDTTKTLTFTGTGEMYSFTSNSSPDWAVYERKATTVIVGEGITSLRQRAFWDFTVLTDVTLPSTLKKIGTRAFSGCTALEAIALPEGLESIPEHCFSSCRNLKVVNIPSTVTEIGMYAFRDCHGLTAVNIPGTVREIGTYAFNGCTGLTELTLNEGLEHIANCVFSGTAIESVVLPDSLTTMSYEAFADCRQLKEVTFGTGLTGIPMRAFQSSAIETLVLPDVITGIGSGAFSGCKSLTSVDLPVTLRRLDGSAFAGCDKLESIELPAALEEFGNGVFARSGLRSVTLPGGCIRVGDNAFQDCKQLTEVNLHDSVRYMGVDVFAGCTALKTVTLPRSIDYVTNGLFRESGLTELEIPYGVREIHPLAFAECAGLGKLLIPPTVDSIGIDAFYGCPDLNIHCYADTYAHRYAVSKNIPFTLIEGDGSEPVYRVNLVKNTGGTVAVKTESHPYRYVEMSIQPDEGYDLNQIGYYCHTEEPYVDIYLRANEDGTFSFLMPECDVTIYVWFFTEEVPFTDVPVDAFYHDPVLWAVNMGITSGLSATEFGPNAPCNRAQVVTFLWRAAGSPKPSSDVNPFTDVAKGSFYEQAVLWAVENGITNGLTETTFGPDATCNRAQVVTFLHRAAGGHDPEMMVNPFTDVEVGSFYEKAVIWAVERGITTGLTETTFGPDATCNRAQVVTFLYRAFAK